MQGSLHHRHDVARPIVRWLESRAVPFDVHRHRPAGTALAAARAEGVPAARFVKVVAVETDDGVRGLVALEAIERLDLDAAAAAFGGRSARLLTEGEIAAIAPLDDPGAMAPIGALYGLRLIAERAIAKADEIVFAGGSHEIAVHVDRAAWERAADVAYEAVAAG